METYWYCLFNSSNERAFPSVCSQSSYTTILCDKLSDWLPSRELMASNKLCRGVESDWELKYKCVLCTHNGIFVGKKEKS